MTSEVEEVRDTSSENEDVISVLEALSTEEFPTGVNRSNRTTPPAADADDQ